MYSIAQQGLGDSGVWISVLFPEWDYLLSVVAMLQYLYPIGKGLEWFLETWVVYAAVGLR